jgi:hypothetical protein
MLTFLPGGQFFAIAGLVAAAAPLVIHLLNRRRFRELDWAAMDFLLEASSRSRSLLELRDLLLLALRTAAVALFGLAIARPFLASRAGAAAGSGPVHAVLVVDNSLSMGRERLGGTTLLDDARTRAKEFIDRCPVGSRVSVLPLCGPAGSYSFDAHRTKEDAVEAVEAIVLVDRAGSAATAIDLSAQAAAQSPDLPDKRFVFIGDQQGVTWPADPVGLLTEAVPEMQVVSVPPAEIDNTWVESLQLEDGIADGETPAALTCVVRHEGKEPRAAVQVTLAVDGAEVATETIDLEPGQSRELTFQHRFDAAAEPGRPASATAVVRLSSDSLPEDDSRAIVVPVVAALPVVFIDQYGAAEDSRRNRFGETRHLRRLLAPVVSRADAEKQLVQVRHVGIDKVDRELLADARMVVVAGVRSPASITPLLREYAMQGGQLVIAAGAEFDPEDWNREAWLEGRGILPVPIAGTVGRLPDEAAELKPFLLDWRSMKDDARFRLPGVPEEELADLYTGPLFFKAVKSDAAPETLAAIGTADIRRREEEAEERRELAAEVERLGALESTGKITPADAARRNDARARLAALSPVWLTWRTDAGAEEGSDFQTPERVRPRVLAAFDNGQPFLVSRAIGRGSVLFVASGLLSPWNTLPRTNAMLLFDRLLREMLCATLPARTIDTVDVLPLPLSPRDRHATIRLKRPDGREETLTVEALGGDAYGVTLRDLVERGLYTVTATKGDPAGGGAQTDRPSRAAAEWQLSIAADGPARESQPQVLDAASFATRAEKTEGFRWVGPEQPINVDGARVTGQGAWWWLLCGSLACLLGEGVVLAAPYRTRGSQSNA